MNKFQARRCPLYTGRKEGIHMQKNLKRASAMILSLAMAVQFGLTDSYYIKANDEQPVEETKQENEASKSNVKDKDASNEDSANTHKAEEKSTNEKSDAEEATTNSDEIATSFSMMLAENANDTYGVELKSQNNSSLGTLSLNVGAITDNFKDGNITLNGKTYSFVEARVIKKSNPTDYTPISYVAVYNGVTYYSTNSITGSPLEAGESIFVILKEDVTQYAVNYKLIVDGDDKTAKISDYITLEGNETSVDTGTSFSFLVKPNKGFTVTSVKQGDTKLTAEGTKYKTNSITDNTNVTIELEEKKEASIRLNGSNTTFVYNGKTEDSTADGKGWAINQPFKTNTNSLSFDLIGRLQYIQEHDRELNKVAVSLHDGSTYSLSKKSINIPTASGQSVETQLTDDLKAIVTKGNEKIFIGNGAYSYRYSVTFSSKNNIYDDIDISTNFKDATASELFVTSTVGVSTITCEKPNGIQILDPAKSDSNFLGLTPDEKYTFKFSVLSGYIPDASEISVEGTVDGKTLDKVTVTKQTNGSFSFEITADQDKYDYRIQVVATKSQYKLAYLDDETVIDSSSKLNAGEQATITSKKPKKDKYVFNGWKIKGDTSSTIYSSNEVVNIDDLISYSIWDATDEVSKITFEPTWLKADEAKSVGYTVLVHFDDGAPDREYDARTAPNKSVKVFKNELEASLGIDPDKYYLDSDQAFDMNNVKDGDVIVVTYHVRKELEVGTLSNVPYSGSTQKLVPTVSAEDNSSLVKGTDYTVSYSDGDYTNVTGENLTVTITGIGKYKGTYPVSYQIIKCPVTLKSASLEKVYDGTALVNGDTALETEEGWVKGEGATYNFTGTQTNAGSSKNAFTYTLKDNTKEGNYSITKKEGTLTVTKQSIVPDSEHPETYKGITISDPKDKVYNGKDQTWVPEVKDAKGKVLDSSCYTVTYDKDDRTNVTGKINVTIKGAKDYKGEVTKTYQIIKCPVTLKSASLEKVYDGTALVNGDTALETEEGWVKGEGATYNFTGTQTNAGSSKNAFTYTLKDNTKEGNYSITKKEGTLTVTTKSIVPDGPDTPEEKKTGITVTKPSDSKYDGEEHKNKPTVTDTKTDKVLVEGKDYELSYSKDVTNAGTVTVTVTGKGNYEESFEVTYEITKRNVTLTSADATKTYDGKALTNTSISVSGDGFVEGEGAEYKVTGTQTQVGNSANEFEYTLNENTLASNYDITKVVGTLTVTAAPAPETPEKPSKQEKPAKPGKVKTGLQTNTGILMIAGTLALAGLGVCVVLARRKRY